MIRLISKLLGPRVLIGIILAAASALAFTIWQWQSAERSASHSANQAAELRQALKESEAEASQARERIDALSDAVELQRAKARKAQQDRIAAERSLSKLEAENEQIQDWSDAAVPDGIRSWLREDD